jgi:hypothetical protein
MHALLVVMILVARVASGATNGSPSAAAAPSATDLLRAKRMADEAAGRLQMRPPKRNGWVRGGGGWERSSAARDDALPSRGHVR